MRRVRTSRGNLCDIHAEFPITDEEARYEWACARNTKDGRTPIDSCPDSSFGTNGAGMARYVDCFFYGFYVTDDYLRSFGIRTRESSAGVTYENHRTGREEGHGIADFVACLVSSLEFSMSVCSDTLSTLGLVRW